MTPEVSPFDTSLAEQMVADHALSDKGREALTSSLTHYMDTARGLGILTGVLVEKETRGAKLWNVYAKDFKRTQNADPRFHRLSVLASQFSYESAGTINLDIRYLNPSRLEEEQERCHEKSIPTTFVLFEQKSA